MAKLAYSTRRNLLKVAAAAPFIAAFPHVEPASATATDPDPIIVLLAEHDISLNSDDERWKTIERCVATDRPTVQTKAGAIECLRTVIRIDSLNAFEAALISSTLTYLLSVG